MTKVRNPGLSIREIVGMAIFAGGVFRIDLRVIGIVDAGPELLLDAVVANAAGTRDILRIDHGARILRWEFGVCAVAVGTGRRYDEPTVYQPAAMHAVFIAAYNIVHIGVDPCRRLLADAMTGSAQHRNIARVGG
jgi:hypothetical protein